MAISLCMIGSRVPWQRRHLVHAIFIPTKHDTMKKIISTFCIALMLYGCTTVRVNLGMKETEFTNKYHTAELVNMSASGNIYRMQLYSNGRYVNKFFYFSNGALIQVDEGQRSPDVVIQHQ